MIGPVFFVLLETSIRRGVRAALALDLGVLLSDLVYIMIAYVFYSEVSALNSGEKSGLLKIIGGSLFILYAFITFFKKVKEMKVDCPKTKRLCHAFLEGISAEPCKSDGYFLLV
jgi:threonine/homoserine/homoserine lactone efflux protein